MAVVLRMFTVAPPVSAWLQGRDDPLDINIIVLRPAQAGIDPSLSASQDLDKDHIEQSKVFVLSTPDGPSLPHGRREPGDKSIMHAIARITLEQTGFAIDRVVAAVPDDETGRATFIVRRSRAGEAPLPPETAAMWLQAADLPSLSGASPQLKRTLERAFEWATHLENIKQLVSNQGHVVKYDEALFPLAPGVRVSRMRDGRLEPDDVAKCYALLDAAVAWLKSIGRTDQWGEVPFSERNRMTSFMDERFSPDDPPYGWVVEDEQSGECLGVLIAGGTTPDYAKQFSVEEAQLYIHLLVTSSSRRGQNLGATLVGVAKAHAKDQGINLVRVDCYNGNDGQLRRWYEKVGFSPVGTFTAGEGGTWQGCVLEQRFYSCETCKSVRPALAPRDDDMIQTTLNRT